MKDRFSKLADLTRGAALVGLGLGGLGACTTNTPPAATGTTTAATPDPAASSTGGAGANVPRKFPVPNAIHRYPLTDDGGAATAGPVAPGSLPPPNAVHRDGDNAGLNDAGK